MASRKEQKEKAREARLAAEREATERASKTRRLQVGGGALAAIIAAVIIVVFVLLPAGSNTTSTASVHTTPIASVTGLKPAPSPGPTGPEGVPIPQAPALASNASAADGSTVDGIQCETTEQLLFHVHTHLTIFVGGAARQIPDGIGIKPPRQLQNGANGQFVTGGQCFYWLHTHAADGIIHIESPVQRTFTLGNFFDIWNQPLGRDQVGPAKGKVTAFYNGQLYKGNPQNIPLGSHTQIQLDVGKPLIAPEKISFGASL